MAGAALLAGLLVSAPPVGAGPGGNDTKAEVGAPAARCEGRSGYGVSIPPRRVYGNTYYVGTCGISAILVTSPAGHVLIDGGIAQAAPLVAASIKQLGFRLADIRWIVASHEHYDHVGALAQLRRLTGARVAALPAQATALRAGGKTARDSGAGFAPVKVDRVLRDGDPIVVGTLRLMPHATPVHAPGSTSWTWRSCERATCRALAYADSVRIQSKPGYRFGDHPERVARARQALAAIAALPCDILMTPHPDVSKLLERLSGARPLSDPAACRLYAAEADRALDTRLRREQAPAAP